MGADQNTDQILLRLGSNDPGEKTSALRDIQSRPFDEAVDPVVHILVAESLEIRAEAEKTLVAIGGEKTQHAVWPLLRHVDRDVVSRAGRVLEKLGPSSSRILLKVLMEPDSKLKQKCLALIGKVDDGRSLSEILPLLKDPDGEVVRAAVACLGCIRSEEAVPSLLNLLDGPYQEEVIKALGCIGSIEATQPLLKIVKDPHAKTHVEALESMGRIGDKSVFDDLSALLRREDPEFKLALLKTLGDLDLAKLEKNLEEDLSALDGAVLLQAISSKDKKLRQYATVLAGLSDSAEMRDHLVSMTVEEEKELQPLLVQSLVRIGKRNPAMLISSLQKGTIMDPKIMAVVLGDIQTTEAIELLKKLTMEDNPGIRSSAYKALGKYDGAEVAELLKTGIKDPRTIVRNAAAQALGWLGKEESVPDLIGILNDKSHEVGESAVGSLLMISGEAAKKALLQQSADGEVAARALAVYGLGVLGGKEAAAALKKSLSDSAWEVRKAGVEALGKLGREGLAEEEIIRLFEDIHPDVRSTVLKSLCRMKSDRVDGLLEKGLSDPDSWVRLRSAQHLVERKGRDAEPLIRQAAEKTDEDLKDAFLDIISRI